MPGIDPRMMKQAMKRMGIKQQEIDALQVIIKTSDRDIVIDNPSVSKVNMMGEESFQISGVISERPLSSDYSVPEISDDDINTVAEQTGKSKDEARKAIEDCNGDLAEAILKLKDE